MASRTAVTMYSPEHAAKVAADAAAAFDGIQLKEGKVSGRMAPGAVPLKDEVLYENGRSVKAKESIIRSLKDAGYIDLLKIAKQWSKTKEEKDKIGEMSSKQAKVVKNDWKNKDYDSGSDSEETKATRVVKKGVTFQPPLTPNDPPATPVPVSGSVTNLSKRESDTESKESESKPKEPEPKPKESEPKPNSTPKKQKTPPVEASEPEIKKAIIAMLNATEAQLGMLKEMCDTNASICTDKDIQAAKTRVCCILNPPDGSEDENEGDKGGEGGEGGKRSKGKSKSDPGPGLGDAALSAALNAAQIASAAKKAAGTDEIAAEDIKINIDLKKFQTNTDVLNVLKEAIPASIRANWNVYITDKATFYYVTSDKPAQWTLPELPGPDTEFVRVKEAAIAAKAAKATDPAAALTAAKSYMTQIGITDDALKDTAAAAFLRIPDGWTMQYSRTKNVISYVDSAGKTTTVEPAAGEKTATAVNSRTTTSGTGLSSPLLSPTITDLLDRLIQQKQEAIPNIATSEVILIPNWTTYSDDDKRNITAYIQNRTNSLYDVSIMEDGKIQYTNQGGVASFVAPPTQPASSLSTTAPATSSATPSAKDAAFEARRLKETPVAAGESSRIEVVSNYIKQMLPDDADKDRRADNLATIFLDLPDNWDIDINGITPPPAENHEEHPRYVDSTGATTMNKPSGTMSTVAEVDAFAEKAKVKAVPSDNADALQTATAAATGPVKAYLISKGFTDEGQQNELVPIFLGLPDNWVINKLNRELVEGEQYRYFTDPEGNTTWYIPQGDETTAAQVNERVRLEPAAPAAATEGGRRKKRTLRKSKSKRSPRSKKRSPQ